MTAEEPTETETETNAPKGGTTEGAALPFCRVRH